MEQASKNKTENGIVLRLSQYVNSYRKEHGMTKAQFARECGVSVGFLRRLEKHEANPTLKLIEKMMLFMKLNPYEMFDVLVGAENLSDNSPLLLYKKNQHLEELLNGNGKKNV